jgi:hypothetical protein
MMIWQSRRWFGLPRSCAEQSSVAQSGTMRSGSSLHTQISDDLIYVSTKFSGGGPHIRVNGVSSDGKGTESAVLKTGQDIK